ncbi:MAG: metal ABC transporter ATP-binding protein [Nitrospinae bacterium]|nr:metal ABC transporter ATP-binding protein [Nitrospinota bacterium]
MPEVIRAKNLSFSHDGVETLSDISFTVSAGDYVGLVGPNGSGKTTLVKALLGIERNISGSVSLFGAEMSEFADWGRVGYLPQQIAHFNPHFPATVREIVALGLISIGWTRQEKGAAVDSALAMMDILKIKDKLIGEISGGQRQRTLLARAIVNRPELLVLDEPTSALDPDTRERFYALLKELNDKSKATVILVTHDLGTIGKYASHLLYVDKSLVFHGGFAQFCESAEMQKYFGEFSQHIICHRHAEEK